MTIKFDDSIGVVDGGKDVVAGKNRPKVFLILSPHLCSHVIEVEAGKIWPFTSV